jgi:hypothetical protein
MKYTLRDFSIFRDNGKCVAVATGPDGVRRNFAQENCKTKTAAITCARLELCEWNCIATAKAIGGKA